METEFVRFLSEVVQLVGPTGAVVLGVAYLWRRDKKQNGSVAPGFKYLGIKLDSLKDSLDRHSAAEVDALNRVHTRIDDAVRRK